MHLLSSSQDQSTLIHNNQLDDYLLTWIMLLTIKCLQAWARFSRWNLNLRRHDGNDLHPRNLTYQKRCCFGKCIETLQAHGIILGINSLDMKTRQKVKLETEASCRGPELFGGWLLHCAGTPEPWASEWWCWSRPMGPLKGSELWKGNGTPYFRKN